MLVHQIFSADVALETTLLNKEDKILLLGDGVYWQADLPLACELYYLTLDAQIRALSMPSFAHALDDKAWVELIAQAQAVKSWF